MKAFADLLERLAFTPGRNAKLALLERFFREVPDPDRGYALAVLTGGLETGQAKPALLRALVSERVDADLFGRESGALEIPHCGDQFFVRDFFPCHLLESRSAALETNAYGPEATQTEHPRHLPADKPRMEAIGRVEPNPVEPSFHFLKKGEEMLIRIPEQCIVI